MQAFYMPRLHLRTFGDLLWLVCVIRFTFNLNITNTIPAPLVPRLYSFDFPSPAHAHTDHFRDQMPAVSLPQNPHFIQIQV